MHLYFKTLQPLEFTDLSNVTDAETREEETGVKLSEDKKAHKFIDTEVADALIELGETEEELLKEFDVVDEREVNYDFDDELDEVIDLGNKTELANTGKATPYRDSEQDGTSKQTKYKDKEFLVRYMYNPLRTQASSREFCRKMVSAKKVYRKEDIIAMTDKVVNAGFGVGGSNKYSIWLWKGGARCKHRWFRKTYMRKDGARGLGENISTKEARSRGFKQKGRKNAQRVSVAPHDMKYEGYTAAYWNKMGFKY